MWAGTKNKLGEWVDDGETLCFEDPVTIDDVQVEIQGDGKLCLMSTPAVNGETKCIWMRRGDIETAARWFARVAGLKIAE